MGEQIIALSTRLSSNKKEAVAFSKEKIAVLGVIIGLLEQACDRSNDGLILISHSSKDVKYAEAIVQLLTNIGIPSSKIICSSVSGTHIPLGEKIYPFLKDKFIGTDKLLYVVCLFSDNYFNSVPCLNEMGAAWVLSHNCSYMLLPGFNVADVEGVPDKNEIMISLENFDKNKHLMNDLKNLLLAFFNLPELNHTDWERHRDAFGATII